MGERTHTGTVDEAEADPMTPMEFFNLVIEALGGMMPWGYSPPQRFMIGPYSGEIYSSTRGFKQAEIKIGSTLYRLNMRLCPITYTVKPEWDSRPPTEADAMKLRLYSK